MPSVLEAMKACRPALLALALCACQAPIGAQPAPAPSREAVQAARDQVQKDPNLGGSRQEQTLRFKDMDSWKSKPSKSEPPPMWLVGMARWIADAGRLVIWALGALAVALFLVGLRHWIRVRAELASVKTLPLPSHVRELDIRPESLPDQIGATARNWWLRGDHREALSLLYRGALSRLVHDHAVPIRAASTEGECVQLATRRLAQDRSDFFARLVSAWQLTVYGARMPDSNKVLALCADFDTHLGSTSPKPEAPR
ncbi:DUF4129 domain-containing protein [Aquabacterium sp.]|uniref:DUF4129 domain-containing protein n=1 Tax=Aquabacterium sp. TaxID=1872578 RepID=UPI002486E071|nr:DUF4129 domain-containing protein [Aquabacterium sp.]MDI1258892.1 DUF4129 domain-containing protein [Aquabacterium sp.]